MNGIHIICTDITILIILPVRSTSYEVLVRVLVVRVHSIMVCFFGTVRTLPQWFVTRGEAVETTSYGILTVGTLTASTRGTLNPKSHPPPVPDTTDMYGYVVLTGAIHNLGSPVQTQVTASS